MPAPAAVEVAPNVWRIPAAPFDFHEPYIRALFRFVGIASVEIVRAEGLALSPEHRETALRDALASAAALSSEPASALAA